MTDKQKFDILLDVASKNGWMRPINFENFNLIKSPCLVEINDSESCYLCTFSIKKLIMT